MNKYESGDEMEMDLDKMSTLYANGVRHRITQLHVNGILPTKSQS